MAAISAVQHEELSPETDNGTLKMNGPTDLEYNGKSNSSTVDNDNGEGVCRQKDDTHEESATVKKAEEDIVIGKETVPIQAEVGEESLNGVKERKGFYMRFLRAWRRKLPTKEPTVVTTRTDDREDDSTTRATQDADDHTVLDCGTNSDNGEREAAAIKEEAKKAGDVKEEANDESVVDGEGVAEHQMNGELSSCSGEKQKLTKQGNVQLESDQQPADEKSGVENGKKKDKNKKKNGKSDDKENGKKLKNKEETLCKQKSMPEQKRVNKQKPRRAFSLGSADGRKRQTRKQSELEDDNEEQVKRCNSEDDVNQEEHKTKRNWFLLRLDKLRQRGKASARDDNPDESSHVEDVSQTHASTTNKGAEGDANQTHTETTIAATAVDIFEPRGEDQGQPCCNQDNDKDISVIDGDNKELTNGETCVNEADVESTLVQDNGPATAKQHNEVQVNGN